MKKLLTFLAITSITAVFSQITITANLPTSINPASTVDAEIRINKGTVGNFAKYQMDVPLGYIVSAIDVKGGNFTFENQRAKIVWVSVPSEAEFAIKFKVQAGSDAVSPGTFSQKFYYLDNNEKKEVEATPISISINGASSVVASKPLDDKVETTTPIVTKTEVVESAIETKPIEIKTEVLSTPVATKVVETYTETKPVVEEKKVVSTSSSNSSNSSNSTSEAGMTFKVQVGAFSNQPKKSTYSNLSNVSIDIINGVYKVTAGSFNTKDEAIKYRDQIQSKGYSGFIAKYKNGVRIN